MSLGKKGQSKSNNNRMVVMKKCILKPKNIKAVSIDSSAKALYFTLSNNSVAKTVQKSEHMYIDYDADGKVVGIELIRIKSVEIQDKIHRAMTGDDFAKLMLNAFEEIEEE